MTIVLEGFPSITTLLFGSRRVALARRKAAAEGRLGPQDVGGASLLGVTFTTFDDLLSSVWEVWGDERRLINAFERKALIFGLLEHYGFDPSLGTAEVVADLVARVIALPHARERGDTPLSSSQERLCDLIDAYERRLEEQGLVESIVACDQVSDRIGTMGIALGEPYRGDDPLALHMIGLFHPPSVEEDAREERHGHPEPLVLLPAGDRAIGEMVFHTIERLSTPSDAFPGKRIALASPDAWGLFLRLHDQLVGLGLQVYMEGSVPLSMTALGSAFLSASSLLMDVRNETFIEDATDFLRSPYARPSLIGFRDVMASDGLLSYGTIPEAMNARWRGDRTTSRDDVISDLSSVSDTFGFFESMLSSGREAIDGSSRVLNEIISGLPDGIEREMELSASAALMSFLTEMRELEADAKVVAALAPDIPVSIKLMLSPGKSGEGSRVERGCVCMVDYGDLISLPHCGFDTVIMADVTDSAFTMTERHDALFELALRWGAPRGENPIQRSVSAFEAAVEAARDEIVFCFPLMDASRERTYPSFGFDRYIIERTGGTLDAEALIKGLPDPMGLQSFSSLDPCVIRMGETNIVATVGECFRAPERVECCPQPRVGELSSVSLLDMLRCADIDGERRVVLSPSSIESYLDCPYAWFIDHVIVPRSLDEGWGALERGSFVHEVFDGFYGEASDRFGVTRFEQIPPGEAHRLFEEVFERELERQENLPPGSGRYIPLDRIEWDQTEKLKVALERALIAQSAFPPEFDRMMCEVRIGYGHEDAEEPVLYAGCVLHGKADRVDMDASGERFYVVDYKGSINGYGTGEGCFGRLPSGAIDPQMLPPHTQALIYASALLRSNALCTDASVSSDPICVGAVYTPYRHASHRELIAGSVWDGAPALSILSTSDSSVHGDFMGFLSDVETAIAVRLEGLAHSDIAPREVGEASRCRYCSFYCSRKGAS